jgi:hypothetical protein
VPIFHVFVTAGWQLQRVEIDGDHMEG